MGEGRLRFRSVLLAVFLLLAPGAHLIAQPAEAEPQGEQAGDLPQLFPEDGLLRAETWVALGQRMLTKAVDYLPSALAALMVFLVFLFLSRVVRRLVTSVLSRTAADSALAGIVSKVAAYGVLVLGTIMAISQAGISVGPLLASVSVIGLAAGLAAQDSLSNLVAGLTILWDRPFRLADRVTIADTYGEVTDINIRTTTIRTPGHRELIIPNREVIEDVIINHSRTSQLRVDIPVGIGYGENIEAARQVLIEAGSTSDYADPNRDVGVVVTGLGASSVDLELRVWLKDPAREKPATFELTEKAKVALDDAGIEIPFPQRVLHLETVPQLAIQSPEAESAR